MKGNSPLNTLKPQPGQSSQLEPKFHPLPGAWAQEQLSTNGATRTSESRDSTGSRKSTDLSRALAAERQQHEYWEQWQGVTPGKPVYEDPRAWQNTLLPTAKYGTDGR